MRFLKNRRLHINMGNYEHIEDTATVEVDTVVDAEALKDNGVDPTDLEAVQEFINTQLDHFLEPGISDAAAFTDEEDSFVLPYEKERTTNRQKRK